MNRFHRRRLLLGAASTLPLAAAVRAQQPADAGFPVKPIRWIVPYASGGATDLIARVVAQHLPAYLAQPVIVENRPGAGSVVGADYVAHATPDGYTLLLATIATNAIAPHLRPVSYDPVKDFAPITQIARGPFLVVVNPQLPVKSIDDLVALAKARPGAVAYGSGGAGSPQHLAAAMFARAAGVQMTHVPYRGSGPAITDLIGGQIQCMFDNTAMQYVAAGKLRAIAATGVSRMPLAPAVPTIRESGLPYEFYAWQGVAAPGGTPAPVVLKLRNAIAEVLTLQEVREPLGRDGGEVVASTPESFAQYIVSENARMREIIQQAGITAG